MHTCNLGLDGLVRPFAPCAGIRLSGTCQGERGQMPKRQKEKSQRENSKVPWASLRLKVTLVCSGAYLIVHLTQREA